VLDIAASMALVLWITANPNWQQGKLHRRRLFLHELATQLLHDHARLHISGHRTENVGIYRNAHADLGIITAATGSSSSLGGD